MHNYIKTHILDQLFTLDSDKIKQVKYFCKINNISFDSICDKYLSWIISNTNIKVSNSWDSKLKQLRNLKVLDFNNININDIQLNILSQLNLEALTHLSINNSIISKLILDFTNMPKLESLNIDNNLLKTIKLYNANNLECLSLDNNFIKQLYISDNILKNLHYFYIFNNYTSSIKYIKRYITLNVIIFKNKLKYV